MRSDDESECRLKATNHATVEAVPLVRGLRISFRLSKPKMLAKPKLEAISTPLAPKPCAIYFPVVRSLIVEAS